MTLDPLSTPSPDTLKSALLERFDTGHNAFVLLDMSKRHPLEEQLSSYGIDKKQSLQHIDVEFPPNQAPLLVQLSGRDDPLLDASIELAAQQIGDVDQPLRQVGGWLFSDRSLGKLAYWLGRQLCLQCVNYHRWRFYDPRTLPHMSMVLDDKQMARLCWGVAEWYYPDEGCNLQAFKAPSDVPEAPWMNPLVCVGLKLDQWTTLCRSGEVGQAIQLRRRQGHAYKPEWIPQLHRLIAQAVKQGFIDPADWVAYAIHGVEIYPQFDRHVLVKNVLSRAGAEGLNFSTAISALNEEALKGIANDLSDIYAATFNGLYCYE
ncbi:MAG: hypothetical protein ACOH2R_05590 [Pseudomonas sp.]